MDAVSDLAAVHAAILADPADLAARHAHADLLEEAGSDARAAFVRASLAGDHVTASELLDPLTWWAWFGNPEQSQSERERRLRVNVQPTPDGVLVHVWARGERINWGYQVVIRRGLIDEVRMQMQTWLDRCPLDFHPVTVYRPLPGRERAGLTLAWTGPAIRLWQDERIGRLRTLDLRALLATADAMGYFFVCHQHAFRPWRGLGEVVLPGSASAAWERECEGRWRGVLDPATRIRFGPPLEDA